VADTTARKAAGRRWTPAIVDGTVKKSVTLRGSVVEEIQARTGTRGFSQFLDEAAARHLALLKAQEIVDDHVARRGEFTNEELAEAQAAWHGE
jgi:hypothetical protein